MIASPGPRVRAIGVALVTTLTLAGCGGTANGDAAATRTVLVSAAASLTDAFATIEAQLEAADPGLDVVLNLAGSATLREQVLGGAPIDVVVTADEATMAELALGDLLADEPTVIATNRLTIAVPAGNPAGVTGAADLADDQLLVGLCAPAVPCGRLAREALDELGVTAAVDTEEPDVRALLTKLAAGELDVGITYVTDLSAAEDEVEGIDLPAGADAGTRYPLAVLGAAPNPADAAALRAFVTGEEGRAILHDAGFGPP